MSFQRPDTVLVPSAAFSVIPTVLGTHASVKGFGPQLSETYPKTLSIKGECPGSIVSLLIRSKSGCLLFFWPTQDRMAFYLSSLSFSLLHQNGQSSCTLLPKHLTETGKRSGFQNVATHQNQLESFLGLWIPKCHIGFLNLKDGTGNLVFQKLPR